MTLTVDKNKNQTVTHKIKQQLTIDVSSGLFTGVLCSGLFNPWDRALYLSVKNNTSFLSKENFKSPYQGFSQAIVQRAFTGSIYYVMQGEMNAYMKPYFLEQLGFSESLNQFAVGMIAGSASGALTNSISTVKYHIWGKESFSFISTVMEMWSHGGSRAFLKGTMATIYRDMVFGCTYEVLRHTLRNQLPTKDLIPKTYLDFIYNATAAGIATMLSGPFNYARTIQYATPPEVKTPTVTESLVTLWKQSKKCSEHPLRQLGFFQKQFKIGWGTARVATGMAIGQKLFDVSREKLFFADSEKTIKL